MHTRAPGDFFPSRQPGLVPACRTIYSALSAEESTSYSDRASTVVPSHLLGALRFVRPWTAYPSTDEGSADHFSEACPASGPKSSGKNNLYSSQQQQANLYSQNLLNITTAVAIVNPCRIAYPGCGTISVPAGRSGAVKNMHSMAAVEAARSFKQRQQIYATQRITGKDRS